MPIIDPERDMKTPEQGAATSVFAATSPLLSDLGGVYLQNSDIAPLEENSAPSLTDGPATGVMPYAVNPESACPPHGGLELASLKFNRVAMSACRFWSASTTQRVTNTIAP